MAIIRPVLPKRYRYYGTSEPGCGGKIGTKGWGPWRYDWYSICSAPYGHDKFCIRCQAGSWHNVWWTEIKLFFLNKTW
jgi:hypothetical protein